MTERHTNLASTAGGTFTMSNGEGINRPEVAMANQKIAKNIPFVIQVSLILFLIMGAPCITLML